MNTREIIDELKNYVENNLNHNEIKFNINF